VFHGPQNAFPAKALEIAVAQLEGLARAGRGPRRDNGPSDGATRERDLGLDGWVSAGVEDLPASHKFDVKHDHNLR